MYWQVSPEDQTNVNHSICVPSHSDSNSPIPVTSSVPMASPILTASPPPMATPDSENNDTQYHSMSRKEFSIPTKWKPTISHSIIDKKLNPDVRNEIVRDLVTHMYGYNDKPTTTLVAKAARLLIEQYPFMADCKTSGSSPHVIFGLIF